MQLLTAAPREHLTEAQVRRLLERAPFVTGGLDVLDRTTLRYVRTVRRLRSCQVTRTLNATIHGTMAAIVDEPLRWGSEMVRPWTELSDGVLTARFDLGVFQVGSPRQVATGTTRTWEVTGLDLLSLLDREVAADYSAASGTSVLGLVEKAITDAGLSVPVLLDGTARAETLPNIGGGVGKRWPLVATTESPDDDQTPVTWLRVVNDLLRAVNYRGVYADPATGALRSEPYRRPADRATEYDWTDLPGVGVAMSSTREIIGNTERPITRWVVISANPPELTVPSVANGLIRQYDLPDAHPRSAANLGLTYPKVYRLTASSPTSLQALLDRQVQTDLSHTTRYEHSTRHFPAAGHADVFGYVDSELGVQGKAQAVRSVVDVFGADTAWTWEAAA